MADTKAMLQPCDQLVHFEPLAYLRQYYGTNDLSRGLKIILCFLPNIAARLPPLDTFVDIGSGPTIFMALGMRQKASRIYLTDYAQQNRRILDEWSRGGDGQFDWAPIAKAIAKLEGRDEGEWIRLEHEARARLAGILYCDVHDPLVLTRDTQLGQFDAVSAIFCLEYASENGQQYAQAVRHVCALVKPGGYLIIGGAFGEDHYTIQEKKFKCHCLSEEELFEALSRAGMPTPTTTTTPVQREDCAYYSHNDAFVIVTRKPMDGDESPASS